MTEKSFAQLPVVFMNEDHEEFAEQLNSIEVLLKGQADPESVDEALQKLIDHTRAHFSREEEQMVAIHFPPYVPHQQEHERVLAGMEDMLARWQQDRDDAWLLSLVNNLWEWFEIHLDTMDRVTAHFIEKAGKAAD